MKRGTPPPHLLWATRLSSLYDWGRAWAGNLGGAIARRRNIRTQDNKLWKDATNYEKGLSSTGNTNTFRGGLLMGRVLSSNIGPQLERGGFEIGTEGLVAQAWAEAFGGFGGARDRGLY